MFVCLFSLRACAICSGAYFLSSTVLRSNRKAPLLPSCIITMQHWRSSTVPCVPNVFTRLPIPRSCTQRKILTLLRNSVVLRDTHGGPEPEVNSSALSDDGDRYRISHQHRERASVNRQTRSCLVLLYSHIICYIHVL